MAQKTQDDEEDTCVEANSKDRAASGKDAGTSGRGDDRPAEGEDWEQEEFGQGDRRYSCTMVEHPAGSNIWFNGTPLKWTDTFVQFSLGVDNVRHPPSVWVRLTSSRIWRGSLESRYWQYCNSKNGAWKPRVPAGGRKAAASKGKGGSKKRKATAEPQDSDYMAGEATGTTKAQQDSDDDGAADTGHCTSPRRRADNGVRAGGSDRTCGPPKESPAGKLEDKGSAKPSKAPTVAVKEEGKASAEPQQASKPSQANLVFQAWLARHFHLLETQGLLNLAPEGCNPEAGRLPRSACADSNRTAEGSLRGRDTSSSSGSAGLKQQGSHTGRKLQLVSKSGSKPVLEPPRSPSPSTPSKPVDGSRRGRSSSADLDLRSQPAGVSQEGPGAPQDAGSNGSKNARRINSSGREGGQDAAAHSQDWEQERARGSKKPEARPQGAGAKANGPSKSTAAKPGRDTLSEKQGAPKQHGVAKAQKKVKTGWIKTGPGQQRLKPEERPGLHSVPSLKRADPPAATLVETDPFMTTDTKKLRVC